MNFVIPPVLFDQKGDNVRYLHQAISWFIQNGDLDIDDGMMNLFNNEVFNNYYGDATQKIVEMLGRLLGFDGTRGIYDDAAARINNKLPGNTSNPPETTDPSAGSPASPELTGRITNGNGKPMSNIRVDVEAVALRGTSVLGQAVTGADGAFSFTYQLPDNSGTERMGIRITALPDNADPIHSQVYFNTGTSIHIELIVPITSADNVADEFTLLQQKIAAVTGATYDSLTVADESFIAGSTGENATLVHMFLLAREFTGRTGIEPQPFYGVMRKTNQQSLEAICNMERPELIDAMSYAVALNIIPHFQRDTLDNFATAIKNAGASIILADAGKAPAESKSYRILSGVLSDTQISAFLQQYYHSDTTADDFWSEEHLMNTVPGVDHNTASRLKLALTYALVSGSNPAVVKSLLTRPAEDSAGKDLSYWTGLLNASMTPDFVFPDDVAGSTANEKLENYAETLQQNFDGAFPVTALQQKIITDNATAFPTLQQHLSLFTSVNPTFNLLRSTEEEIKQMTSFGISDSDVALLAEEVGAVQRLSMVAPSYQAMSALKSAGLSSAQAITQQPQQQFVQNFASALGGASGAAAAYSNATQVNMVSQVLAAKTYTWISNYVPSIYATPPDANPDWRSLFGTVDFCTCSDCMSVFSPAAYLVDSLELLRKNNTTAYNWLKSKRPDLWDLALTCKNTNVPLPYIDLVNELLEDMMDASGKAANTAPLYKISAHDTTLDSRTLRAVPQYIRTVSTTVPPSTTPTPSPYVTLKDAVYPWSAPYNYYSEQTSEFLGLIDLKPYQVAQTFSNVPDSYALNDVNLACAYLRITDAERAIISDTNTANVNKYYGYGTGVNLLPAATTTSAGLLNAVNNFIQKSGLSFNDLLELLDCYYINALNPNLTPSRHLGIRSINGTACDTTKMTIDGLTLADLLSIHRFVRLQRHTGWTKYELDRAFQALGITAGAAITDGVIIAIAQIKRLTEVLNCSVDEVLPFWGDIAHKPYRAYSGDSPELLPTQYERFFRNQAVVPNFQDISNYPFPSLDNFATWQAGLQTAGSGVTKPELDYILAAFRLSEQDFDYLVRFFNTYLPGHFQMTLGKFSFTYTNMLKLLRECTFARLMRLDIADWCFFRNWLNALTPGIDPFAYNNNSRVAAALIFIEKVKALRNSDFSTDTLHYLFDDGFSTDADKEAKQSALFTSVKDLRNLLAKLNKPVGTTVDAKALIAKLELVMDSSDAAFVVNYIGNLIAPDNTAATVTAADRAHLEALLPGELSGNAAHDVAYQLTNLTPAGYTPSGSFQASAAARLTLINNVFTRAILKGQVRHYLSTTHKLDLAVCETLLGKWIRSGSADAYDILLNETYINGGDPIPASGPLPATTQQVLLVLERFAKAAVITGAAKLSIDDTDFYLKNKTALGIPDIANLPVGTAWNAPVSSTPVSPSLWTTLIDWLYVQDAMMPSPTGLVGLLKGVFSSTAASAKIPWFSGLLQAVQISATDLESLIGDDTDPAPLLSILGLNFTTGNPHLQPATYKRLLTAMDMRAILEVNMETCKIIAATALHPQAQADADLIVQAVKARYDNNEWLEQSQPINDRLRTGRRDAMVAYLLANPPLAYASSWFTSDDIFETLLIDTEMMPIVQTSRIKQAISTVQLFVDRCVLQEELPVGATTAIQLTADTISQWNLWRKWYRIWEANRKVFVYPENWIEPDLRDDKSPIFKDLEKYLKQNDITADTMEDAYRTYLERLDEVAHLDVVAYHTEDIRNGSNSVIDTIVHVWGRSRSAPHLYYYRNRTGNIWSAWEKMDTQIEGDTFAGVKWRGRLRLYWLSFMEQAVKQTNKISVNQEQEHERKYWKIELNWTEFKNGRWQPRQVGKESIQTESFNAWTTDTFKYYFGGQRGTNVNEIWTLPYTVDSFADSFAALKAGMMLHADINGDGDLQLWLQGGMRYIRMDAVTAALNGRTDRKMSMKELEQQLINKTGDSQAAADSKINQSPYYTSSGTTQRTVAELRQVQSASHIANQFWRDRIGEVIADMFYDSDYIGQVNNIYNDAVSNNTVLYKSFRGPVFVIKHNKVHTTSSWPYMFYNDLYENLGYISENGQYNLEPDNAAGYKHIINRNASTNSLTTVPLLAKSPQYGVLPAHHQNVKHLVFDRMVPQGTNSGYRSFPRFFYKDYQNAFFVEKVTVPVSIVAQQPSPSAAAGKQLTGVSIGASGTGIVKGATATAAKQATAGNPSQPALQLGNGSQPTAQAFTAGSSSAAGGNQVTNGIAKASTLTADFYRFYPFYHYRTNELMDQLDSRGLDGLFDWDFILSKTTGDEMDFGNKYLPTSNVLRYLPDNQTSTDPQKNARPTTSLDFRYDSPNAIYNWELFFHIPLLIANKLMQDQKFAEAMKWFHYVFNPTNISGGSHGNGAARFWQFHPFFLESGQVPSVNQVMTDVNLPVAVQQWAMNPFKPHLVARTRISAYMKNVLMKYLDNLIAWGDQLFRRDTMEQINEATLLYILASQLLGKAPVKMPAFTTTAPKAYKDLSAAGMNAFSNAQVAVETILAPTGVSQAYGGGGSGVTPLQMYYFCIPPNDKLLSYWGIVADRLFKIRNSQNIDGVERQLALFEPPIDPALLVKAAASGVSLSDAVNELFAPLPQYRFSVLVQKASELAQEVKSLGGSMLMAIEKKDAEHISLLRSNQEISVLEAAKDIRLMQIQEAQAQIAGLQEQQNIITIRRDYYQNLLDTGLNSFEQSQLDSLQNSIPLKIAQGVMQTLGGTFRSFPDFKLGAPFTLGATFGGSNLGGVIEAGATAVGIAATINDIQGSMAGIKAGHVRRAEDWKQQLKAANAELKQLDKQLISAQIREAIAEKELANHSLQYQNALDLDQAMHDKYSNEELYDWMISQLAITYFQSYKLAFDVAKRAERCYAFEIGDEPTTPFIQFGYWDSLKKGLLAGEALLYDIKRMDVSFLDQNKRLHEMTKHISLAALDAGALLKLKGGSKVQIKLPEWLFDMDYPGHYMRRIKSVSLSIPCVAGPYTTVSAKLTLLDSRYRKNPLLIGAGNTPPEDQYKESGSDSRFVYTFGGSNSIATSAAQNDSGMFEMNFRDDRYLPFEGAGAVSTWALELPSKYASFDIDSISDIIFHVHYTAKYDGGLANAANAWVQSRINNLADGALLPRLFNVKQEFANEWAAYEQAVSGGNTNAVLTLPISLDMFPYFCKGKTVTISNASNDASSILFKATRVSGNSPGNTLSFNTSGSPAVLSFSSGGTPQNPDFATGKVGAVINSTTSYPLSLKISGIAPSGIASLWLALIYKVS